MDYQKLKISFTGPMTEKFIDLHSLGIVLYNVQSIFDRSYCHYTNHKRMTVTDRNNLKLVAFDFQRGSIVFDAGLAAFTLQQSLAISQTVDPKLILDTSLAALKYLYYSLVKTNENNPAKVIIKDSPGAYCFYQEGENALVISNDTASVARDIRPCVRRLSKAFSSGDRGSILIESSDKTTDGFKMTEKTARLFSGNKVVSDVPIKITGIVRTYSADKQSGKFEVLCGNVIPACRYSFSIDKDFHDNADIFIDSLKGTSITVSARIQYDVSPETQSKITKLFLSPLQ